jgi:glutathione gamma-glutamylcysteinyltransferase
MHHNGLKSFYHLIQQHSTQAEPAYCGISTLAISLNAFSLDPRQSWKGTPWRWYDENLLNCCVPLETIQKTGITLPTFACLAKCQGVLVTVHYAQDVSEDDFRDAVRQAFLETTTASNDNDDNDDNDDKNHLEHILVVSYDRSILKQTGTGHFSPIAAYDSASDSVLILDTARFKYGVHWVSLRLMFQAMQTIDPDTQKSRGFAMLTNQKETHGQESFALPVSLLLRSTMAQASVRQEYKVYLTSFWETTKQSDTQSTITWDDVVQFWTEGTDASRIWKLTKPRPRPTPDETELLSLIADVRTLINLLLPKNGTGFESKGCCNCGPHDQRTLDLREDEAMLIIYLASLPEHDRNNLVLSVADATDAAKELLLAEAKLLRIAIDMSDTVDND